MDIAVLQRAYGREKARRVQAEQLLESKSRDLYLSYEKLSESNRDLLRINTMLELKQKQLLDLNHAHNTVTNDLKLAANLQLQILPSAICIDNIEANGLSKPAMFVAGDIYDYYNLSDSVMAFYMADVTGHGPAAAMVSYAIHKQMNPKSNGICATNYRIHDTVEEAVMATVSDLNMEYALLEGDSHYFTLVYGLLNTVTGEVCLCQAGHPAPVHYSQSTHSIQAIGNGGFPVGMFADLSYTANTCTLGPGDSLYIYSDGITECFSPEGEAFGESRLFDSILSTGNTSLAGKLKGIEDNIINWNNSDVFGDDVSILALKRH